MLGKAAVLDLLGLGRTKEIVFVAQCIQIALTGKSPLAYHWT